VSYASDEALVNVIGQKWAILTRISGLSWLFLSPLPLMKQVISLLHISIAYQIVHHILNSFAPRLIQAVNAKTPGSHVVLHGNFSSLVSATDSAKSSKHLASLVVCIQTFLVGCGFVVSDIISGGLLGHLGPLHLALGPNRWMVVFC